MIEMYNHYVKESPYRFNFILKIVITILIIQCSNLTAQQFDSHVNQHTIIDGFPYGMFINGSFSKSLPAGWYYSEWSRGASKRKQRGGMVKKYGYDRIMEIPACDKGMIGWASNSKELLKPFRPVKVTGKVRHDRNYKGSIPRVFISFYEDRKKFIGIKFLKIKSSSSEWNEFEYVLTPDDVPPKANWFKLNIVSMAKSTQKIHAGNAYFADVKAKVQVANGNKIQLRPNKPVSCWNIQEKVIFKLQGVLPEDTIAVSGILTDSKSKKVAEVVVPVENVKKSGWQWQPEKPGFYTLQFSLITTAGRIPVSEDYLEKAWKTADWTIFNRTGYNVAIFAKSRRKPADVPAVFGINASLIDHRNSSGSQASVKQFDALLGQLDFNFIRWHNVSWASIESSEKGDYQWENLDNHINWSHKQGYISIINFYKTPKWASPVKDDKLNITSRYSTYAPENMQDWNDFINTMIKRYQHKVNTWEVWNEPHLPGNSVFWNDTPENFVKLLKNAYETIKEVQPESEVWLGGIGMRYIPFYLRIIKLGAGNYFDYLSLHGPMVSPEPFRDIDKKYKSPTHPWVNSEWHASLVRYNSANYKLNDQQLTYNLLKDALRQLKLDVQRITYFDLSSSAFREILDLYARNSQSLSHNSGLIVRKPFPQPKFQCQTWQTFTSMFAGKIEFKGEYIIDNIKVVALQSGNGKLLVAWYDEEQSVRLPVELTKIIGADTSISDWEGAPSAGTNLQPFKMYYIVNPTSFPEQKYAADDILSPLRTKRSLSNDNRGLMVSSELFDPYNGKLVDDIKWNTDGFVRSSNKVTIDKARFALGVTPEFLDLVVEIKDNVYHPVKGNKPWQGDSIQFAVDPVGYGLQNERVEFYTINSENGPNLFKQANPDIYGDLPDNWSPSRTITQYAKVLLQQKDQNKTRYLIRIPNSEFYPYQTDEMSKELRFSLLINDNDGEDRNGWIEWGGGIGESKDPALYGTVVGE